MKSPPNKKKGGGPPQATTPTATEIDAPKHHDKRTGVAQVWSSLSARWSR